MIPHINDFSSYDLIPKVAITSLGSVLSEMLTYPFERVKILHFARQ
jgi:hypothetical protein